MLFDNGRRQATALNAWLLEHRIAELIIMGLATDYCVKFTVLDALDLGYTVSVITDGCRGVNIHPVTVQRLYGNGGGGRNAVYA